MPPDCAEELMASGGDFVVETGSTIPDGQLDGSQVFIVTEGVASKFQQSPTGRFSEVGMVGCEGMFPVSALLNVPSARHVVLVQVGLLRGRRVRTKDFQRIIADSESARDIVHRYLYAFLIQISSNLLCAEQSVTSRLARWLLMCHDRIPDDAIEVTHDALAQMTVSHRPTITNTLQALRAAGMIEMCRGRITIRDRAALIAASDGGYGAAEQYWQEQLAPLGNVGASA